VIIAKEGFRQRYFGGLIKPVNVGALTIPVIPAAYGRRAREFKDLVFIKFNKPGKVLGMLMKPQKGSEPDYFHYLNGEKVSSHGNKGKFGTVYYLLMASVRQKANKDILPSLAQYEAAVIAAVKRFLGIKNT
jgi:hypothetical protein